MEYEVTGCINCPLCKTEFNLTYYCDHPDNSNFSFIIELDANDDLITPDRCPLNNYPLMIKKKNWQIFENFWNKNN